MWEFRSMSAEVLLALYLLHLAGRKQSDGILITNSQLQNVLGVGAVHSGRLQAFRATISHLFPFQ
jgi:hypothetical protein